MGSSRENINLLQGSVISCCTDNCKVSEALVKDVKGEMCKLRKIQLSPEVVIDKASILKFVYSCIQKISDDSHTLLIGYKKVYFEGPLSDQCYKVCDITCDTREDAVKFNPSKTVECPAKVGECHEIFLESLSVSPKEDTCPTYLCISSEKYDYITFKQWLKDREEEKLFEVQIIHIMSQVISAVSALVDKNLTKSESVQLLHDIHVVRDPVSFVCDTLPSLKLTNLDFEFHAIALRDGEPINLQNETKSNNLMTSISRLFTQLFGNLNYAESSASIETYLSTVYPSVWEVIQEISTCEMNESALTRINVKMENLKEKYSCHQIVNVDGAMKTLTGIEVEISKLLNIITATKPESNLIIIEGPSGMGKTSLVNELVHRVLLPEEHTWNIFQLNVSSNDSLTTSLHKLALKLQITITDHIGNVRSVKDVYHELLTSFAGKRLLLIFDDAGKPSGELVELLQIYKENVRSFDPSPKHFLILVVQESWKNYESVLERAVKVVVPKLDSLDCAKILQKVLQLKSIKCPLFEDDLGTITFCKILQFNPAAIQLFSAFAKHCISNPPDSNPVTCRELLQLIVDFREKMADLSSTENSLDPTSLIYSLILLKLYNSSNLQDQQLISDILSILQYANSTYGLSTDSLVQILSQSFGDSNLPTMEDRVHYILNTLTDLSLVKLRDNVVYMQSWMQQSLTTSFSFVLKDAQQSSFSTNLLSRLNSLLSLKDLPENDYWKLIPYAATAWLKLTRNNDSLAKDFSAIPEHISRIANRSNRFDEVAGFVRDSFEVFATAFKNQHDIHILKLKFLLAERHLLPHSKVNEAFIIFKTIHEQSRTDPKENLMLKLKSLIELGQIHITRQEYEKSISYFQQVQIFAVQKISLLELDSEPTVLKSRMLHGYSHLLQNNLGEAKKLLLQVIPFLDKYTGAEMVQVKILTLKAKFFLATVLRKTGDLVNALMMQTKVLEERERLLGSKHPDTWASKQEMAMLFSAYDNHEKALELLREVLEVQEEILGAPSNRQSLSTMNAIAEIEAKLGNFDDALELYEAIDLIEQQVLPENDEMRVSSQLNQADVLMALGQYKEAVDIFNLVYALRTSSCLEDNLYNVELCGSILSKREKAERSMEILGNYWLGLTPENLDDPSDLGTLSKKHEVAVELLENQDYHGALRFLREVVEDSTHLECANRFLLNVKAQMARVLGLVGNFNESFSLYKEIIPLMDSIFGETDELTMLCKDTMGQVFLFSGNQYLKRQMSNLKWFLL